MQTQPEDETASAAVKELVVPSRIQVSMDEGVATITLDDSARRNALSDELLDELLAALVRVRADEEVRVVVLASSHESVFSAGGDLAAFGDGTPSIDRYDSLGRFPAVFRSLVGLGKPVVCAARGHVLAGGLGLALACDLILAAESATFGCPEIDVGVFPFMVSGLLRGSVGRAAANDLLMLGRRYDARAAHHVGLVTRVVADADFDAELAGWTSKLASSSPLLLRLGKDALRATRDMTFDQALDHLQAQLALAFTSQDLVEGVTAFVEKREPAWQGR